MKITLAALLKALGCRDVIALAAMGLRAVLTPDGGYALVTNGEGPNPAIVWANPSDRATVMPRRTNGRFVPLALLELTLLRRIAEGPVAKPSRTP